MQKLDYPITVRNYDRKDLTVENQEELLNHLCREKSEISPIVQIGAARIQPSGEKISPMLFLTEESIRFMNAFIRFKRFGLSALYQDGEVPEGVLQAFDIIQTVLDKIDQKKRREIEKKYAK